MTDSGPQLALYDTLTASKRPFIPVAPGRCGVYCCGPTVYDMSHIGHAAAALLPDVLVRFLRQQGLDVTYVRNITDIDDKIIARAHEAGRTPEAIAQHYAAEYERDVDSLGMLRPDVTPRVTGHIPEIIALIEGLFTSGLAYRTGDDVYFDVEAYPAYGALSKRDPEELRAGARVEVDPRKRAPADFALWKASKPGEPAWDSPWGRGRPGWHIECSAMSMRHLGITFDVHTGGQDLVFPHHENEIAQSRGCHGESTYARYWLHNGFVRFAGEKMSKSLGNFFTIREVTARYHPEALRFFLLTVHYRSGIGFDVELDCPTCGAPFDTAAQERGTCSACGTAITREELRARVRFPGLEEADERVAYVYDTLLLAREAVREITDDGGPVGEPVGGMLSRFIAAMRDDLNTAAALSELSEPLAAVNRLLAAPKGDKQARRRTLVRFLRDFAAVASILGTFERDPATFLAERRDLKARRIDLDVARVEALVAERVAARERKDWARADELRETLTTLGVKIRDGHGGTQWSL